MQAATTITFTAFWKYSQNLLFSPAGVPIRTDAVFATGELTDNLLALVSFRWEDLYTTP